MVAFVLDASVLVALYVEEHVSRPAAAVLEELEREGARFAAPDLLAYEVANALRKRVARQELTPESAIRGLSELLSADIELYPAGQLARPALALAMAHDLTAYDASYLALCATLGATLLTADRALASRAEAGGFAVRAVEPE